MKIEIDVNWIVDFLDELFISPFKLRLDLNESAFAKWVDWFYTDLVKCDMWSCGIESDSHGIEELCGCSSIFLTYQAICKELPGFLEPDADLYFPVFDPIEAHHLPGSGWVYYEDGKEIPVKSDVIKDWDKYFPKRSCFSCAGRYGDTSIKKCSHSKDSMCGDECYEKRFQSWCPLMNSFLEKQGYIVDRSLEHYAQNRREEDKEDLKEVEKTENEFMPPSMTTPLRVIQRYIDKYNGEKDDEERRNSKNN